MSEKNVGSEKVVGCIKVMLDLQNSMNQKVHPQWQEQGYEWHRAIWVECAELMDHYGWKWWKKQSPDMEQVKLEVIDIWHFGLSYLLVQQSDKSIEKLAAEISTDLLAVKSGGDFKEALENFTQWTLVNRGFNVQEFSHLMAATEMDFDALYLGYVGKNVLNFFRQDHGYKDGTYIKVWNGLEDNEHLVEACSLLDANSSKFKDELYAELARRYKLSA